MFRFASPYAFFLLLPLAVAAVFVWRRRVKQGILFSALSRVPAGRTTLRSTLGMLLPIVTLIGILLCIFAAARPQTNLSEVRDTTDVLAIEMVVDVSGSMRALDFSTKKPSGDYNIRTRLDVVKETFTAFVDKRLDDLIGLVSFGGFATTRAPLTTDHDALKHVLQAVEIPDPDLDEQGRAVSQEELMTAIGDAIATASARLEKADTQSKVMVLLSDGESNTGIFTPEAAMESARELGIKIYTIGVGTTGRVPVYVRDRFGRQQIRHQFMRLDEQTLRGIAEHTNGQYFNVKNPSGLEKALASINKLETTEIERSLYVQYEEWFVYLLLPGVALILTGLTLNMLATRRLI